jgi:FixJ family two-component response regulator
LAPLLPTIGPTIVLVDDDDEIRGSVGSFLRAAGLDVRGFAAAEDFLASPGQDEVSCLVTDLHMPGMDGLMLQKELKRIGLKIPIIVMTAYPTPFARAQSAHLGAVALLPKPVDPDELLHRIQETLA